MAGAVRTQLQVVRRRRAGLVRPIPGDRRGGIGLLDFRSEDYAGYRSVNRQFAAALLPLLRPDDVIWVHDYQLMLLPAMLREAMPSLRIGFFLHTPFPSYEVFRIHPKRVELAAGLLGADQIGFHTFGPLA